MGAKRIDKKYRLAELCVLFPSELLEFLRKPVIASVINAVNDVESTICARKRMDDLTPAGKANAKLGENRWDSLIKQSSY